MKPTWLIRSWRGVLLSLVLVSPAYANVHLMQIEQVIGGVNGDATAQAVQLRMRAANQKVLKSAKLWAHSADGTESVLLIDFTSNVPGGGAGARILVATPAFLGSTSPAATPDFTMDVIPQSYLAAGSITFENNTGTKIYWRLSWGGAAYTGPTTGSTINDADGEFGPPFSDSLPSSDTQALLFQGLATDPSTNNFDDYAFTGTPAVFTNNSGENFTVTAPSPGCTTDADCTLGELCCSGTCTTPVCSKDDDCNDGDFCTTDTCSDPKTCAAACNNTPLGGHNAPCNVDADCCSGKCRNNGRCSKP